MKELLDRFSVERLEEIIGRAEFWGHGGGYTPCEVIALARIALAVKQDQTTAAPESAFKAAFHVWQEKTEWVQTDRRFDVLLPCGKHRADVLREYIERLEAIVSAMQQPAPDLSILKRYDLDMSDCDSFGQDCGADMVEAPDGDYVLFADVVYLLTSAPESSD